MRTLFLTVSALLLALATATPVSGTADRELGRSAPAPDVESDTANRIREAWSEIHRLQRAGQVEEAELRQSEYAGEFFDLYLAQPEARPGQQALATAFRMWGNASDDQAIEAALSKVDRGSRHWVGLIQSARPAFAGGGRLDEFRELVAGLAAELTAPSVASEVWLTLGRDYRSSGDRQRAEACFRQVIALDADPRLVETAGTALRELDRLAPGRAAPDFTATDLRGRAVRLADLEGRAVLLLFWSTDCSTCLPAIDHLRRIRAAYASQRLELIGIALDSRAGDARRIVEERKIDWPQICDGQAADGPVARLYEVHELPRTILIDRQGRIVAKDLLGDELDAALARVTRETEQRDEPSGPR